LAALAGEREETWDKSTARTHDQIWS